MTESEAKDLALRRVRNSPARVMGIIHRYVQRMVREGRPPLGVATEPYDHVDILHIEQELIIDLYWHGVADAKFLCVSLTPEHNASIKYKGFSYREYHAELQRRRGMGISYMT